MSSKVYYKNVDIELYNTQVHFYKSNTVMNVSTYLYVHENVELPDEDVFGSEAFSFRGRLDGRCKYYICLSNSTKKHTVIHEMLHTTFHILEEMGVPISYENSEVFCYLIGLLSRKFNENKWKKLDI